MAYLISSLSLFFFSSLCWCGNERLPWRNDQFSSKPFQYRWAILPFPSQDRLVVVVVAAQFSQELCLFCFSTPPFFFLPLHFFFSFNLVHRFCRRYTTPPTPLFFFFCFCLFIISFSPFCFAFLVIPQSCLVFYHCGAPERDFFSFFTLSWLSFFRLWGFRLHFPQCCFDEREEFLTHCWRGEAAEVGGSSLVKLHPEKKKKKK